MKRVCILVVLTIAISCTQVKEFPDAPYIGITYGTIQTRLLKYGIDINKHYIHAMPCYHEIALNTKSRLATICGLQNITVNSYHHQAAKKVAKGFIVNANSLDGSIEGIEYSGNVFIVGTQFHPEMMREENPVFDTVFTVFVNEAHAYKKCKTKKFFGRPDKVGASSK